MRVSRDLPRRPDAVLLGRQNRWMRVALAGGGGDEDNDSDDEVEEDNLQGNEA